MLRKIYSVAGDIRTVNPEVNSWLSNHQHVTIIDILQSSTSVDYVLYTIVYTEDSVKKVK